MSKRRSGLGPFNPLSPVDALLGAPETKPARPSNAARSTPAAAPPARTAEPRKTRVTYVLSPDVIRAARAAVMALAGPPLHLTLSELVETALRRELQRLSAEHNRGRPFGERAEPLKAGRRIRE